MNAELADAIQGQLARYGSLPFAALVRHLREAGVTSVSEKAVHDELHELFSLGAVGCTTNCQACLLPTAGATLRARVFAFGTLLLFLVGGLNFVGLFVFPCLASLEVDGSPQEQTPVQSAPMESPGLLRSNAFFMTEHYPPDEHTVERYRSDVLQQEPQKKERRQQRSDADPAR
jgi:hypothetical protein